MTPLVIGLAIVVVVILIAVAVGMRHVRNAERAGFTGRPAGRGAGSGLPDPGPDRQLPRPDPLQARTAGVPRSRDPQERAGRRGDRAAAAAGPGRDARRHDSARGRDHDNGSDEPDFRTAQRQEARAQARGRQVRGRRDDDGDWPSTDWDDLSDADYWKEVASDRPLVTTARAAQPGPARPGHDARQARAPGGVEGAGHAAQLPGLSAAPQRGRERPRDAAPLPARGAPQPATAGRGHDFLAAPAAGRGQDPGRPEPARPGAARPGTARPGQVRPVAAGPEPGPRGQRPEMPVPADDDPLTSPSFPRIVTSDSRSYYAGRPAVPAGRSADPALHSAPTTQFASYDAGATRSADGAGGYHGSLAESSSATTAPRSYRPDIPPGTGSYGTRSHSPGARPAVGQGIPPSPPLPPGPPAPAPAPAAASPAGNPYGSYVSADLPGYQDLPAPGYQAGRSGPGRDAGQPASQPGSHRVPQHRQGPQAAASVPQPDSRAGSWYPQLPAAATPVPAPGPMPPPAGAAGLHDGAGMYGRANGNGHRGSPSGYPPASYPPASYPPASYPPASYPPGPRDAAGYPQAGNGAVPEAGGYPSAGRHSARPQNPPRLPPELSGRDGYGGR